MKCQYYNYSGTDYYPTWFRVNVRLIVGSIMIMDSISVRVKAGYIFS